MPRPTDTIAAIATPPGRGGVGIVRVSGPAVSAIASAVLGKLPAPRHADYVAFRDADDSVLDSGLALYFPGPHSFTGEDVLELHAHGGPVVLDLLLRRVLTLGARLARPGEFTERAFLNDKIDLAQAEAIADLIDSASEEAARSALRSLQGEFSRLIDGLVEELIALRAYVEAAIDFPDEEVEFLSQGQVGVRLGQARARLAAVLASARRGSVLREGLSLVIAGRPNAGKSSLLNALAGHDAAIVTAIPGTTRDVLREHIHLDGLPLRITDTAGLRDSDDPVEQEGVRRARLELQRADHILLIVDSSQEADQAASPAALAASLIPEVPDGVPITVVHNKIDLAGAQPRRSELDGVTQIWLSALEGAGLDLLRDHLKRAAGYEQGGAEGSFMARRRHLDALTRAQDQLIAAAEISLPQGAAELLAEDLRQAQQALSEITGAFTSDELLGRIFASFCIGK